jgi:ATP-binding protein involved in chromosome partitioning
MQGVKWRDCTIHRDGNTEGSRTRDKRHVRQYGTAIVRPVPASQVAIMTPAQTHDLTVDVASQTLREILDARRDVDRSSSEVIRHISVCGSRVKVHLELQVSGSDELAELDAAVSDRFRALGASDVEVVVRRPEPSHPGPLRGRGDPWAGQARLATVQHVVAVGAGKGGVGKSTIAVNLALALGREGLRAALLDADIYGPSLPILLGIEDGAARARMTPERHILPLQAHGLPLVSFGFFLGEGSPAIWRGPMVSKAVQQFARGVAWPSLDVLIVDLPPGTGDVPLSLAQAIELSGAVVVTQPARVAMAEARKAVQMFSALEVRVLGVVENMTGPFGIGAGQSISSELGVPFLGDVPFDAEIVREGDLGTPTVIARPDSLTAASFDRVAQRIAEALGWRRVVSLV